jgi:hypothetical protein
MAELIVKLTATSMLDGSINPGNSADSDDSYAQVDGSNTPLERNTGDHDSSNLGTITKVEYFCEHYETGTLTDDLLLLSGGYTTGGLKTLNFSASEVIQYIDITSDRAWAWADFSSDASLFINVSYSRVKGDDGVAIYADQIGFRITYTPPSASVQNEVIAGVIQNEVIAGVVQNDAD